MTRAISYLANGCLFTGADECPIARRQRLSLGQRLSSCLVDGILRPVVEYQVRPCIRTEPIRLLIAPVLSRLLVLDWVPIGKHFHRQLVLGPDATFRHFMSTFTPAAQGDVWVIRAFFFIAVFVVALLGE